MNLCCIFPIASGIFLCNLIFAQNPPLAKKIAKTDTVHGYILTDNYHWLKNRQDPEVLKYIKQENAYTEQMTKHTSKSQEQLYKEIIGRIKQTDMSVPYKIRRYSYYRRTQEGENYNIWCRKNDSPDAKEEILLDANQFIKENKCYGVYPGEISPDDKILPCFVDNTGNFENDVFFKDMKTQQIMPDTLFAVSSLEFANDSKTIFYSVQDSTTNRTNKVFRHILGTNYKSDVLIYEEKDSIYNTGVGKSKSDQYIYITNSSSDQDETWYLNADHPFGNFRIFQKREKGHKYGISHFGDKFYILTDNNAVNFRLMETDTGAVEMNNWKEIIPHREDVMIKDIEIFRDYLVLTETHLGLNKIRIIRWSQPSRDGRYISFDDSVYSANISYNPDFNTEILRYGYESLITPYSIYEYNMNSGEQKLLKREAVLGGYDPLNYRTERIWATAPDGTRVPISIAYRKEIQKTGKNPVYLSGYGSYGYGYDAEFNSSDITYLDSGFICAIAHVRGGNDLGMKWYEDGKMMKKKNTFTDFNACAEKLISDGYTSAGLIVAEGASAGGLLMGYTANNHAELYKALIFNVPFVDVINTMLDPSMPLTTGEYEEWGDPGKKDHFEYMLSYSPYNNVKRRPYPHMLFLTGMSDEQVAFHEPLKMVAKLRAMKSDDNKLLIKIQMSSGHGGVSGRYNYYREIAFRQAFVLGLF